MIFDVLCQYQQLRTKYKNQRKARQAFHNHVAKLEDHIQLWQAVGQWLVQHHAQLISDLPNLLHDKLQRRGFRR